MITPLVGLIGGVWGFLWKSSTTAATPGTVDMKAPSLSRFPRDKPVIPALLSVAGTALPLYILYVLVGALFTPPQPPPGSEGPGVFFLLLPAFAGGAAFLISRNWLLCSRMFPSRSTASDDVKLWLPRHKCRICGVEVEFTQVRAHYQTTHPEFAKWGRKSRTLGWLVVGSGVALVIVDALYFRSLSQILQYIVPAYLLGASFLLIGLHLRKLVSSRDAWEKTHPSSSSEVA